MPTGVIKIRGKIYSKRTTHSKKSNAKKKAKKLRDKGHNAVVRKSVRSGKPQYTVYARKKFGVKFLKRNKKAYSWTVHPW